jgi:hypothetical protein
MRPVGGVDALDDDRGLAAGTANDPPGVDSPARPPVLTRLDTMVGATASALESSAGWSQAEPAPSGGGGGGGAVARRTTGAWQ